MPRDNPPRRSRGTGLPRVTGRTTVRALERAGFRLSHVRGSHHYLRKSGENVLVTVPVHGNRDLPDGTLRAIIKQAEMTVDQFRALL